MKSDEPALDEALDVSRPYRWVWLLTFIMFAMFGAAVAFARLCPGKTDPYKFLGTHKPFDTGLQEPGGDGPREIRLYSWRQSVIEVQAAAARELSELGFKEDPPHSSPNYRTWHRGDLIVGILAGHALSRKDGGRIPAVDTSWVTVIMVEPVPNNWQNVLRYTFDPVDYH